IELRAKQTLTRTIRLSFRPGAGGVTEQAGNVPLHWLGGEPASLIDGVGESVATALTGAGATTVRQLAALDLATLPKGISRARAVELKAKAQLALQTPARLTQISGLSAATPEAILVETRDPTPPADQLDRLQAQVGLLQVALDARWLKRRTLTELVSSRAP